MTSLIDLGMSLQIESNNIHSKYFTISINSKKRREQEMRDIIKKRNSRYGKPSYSENEKVPDFERQLTHAFNIKFKRADWLGVRNLIVDKDQIMRASRPNMDKLIVLEKIKHEICNPKLENEDNNSQPDSMVADPIAELSRKFDKDVDFKIKKEKESEVILRPPLLKAKLPNKK